MASEALRDQENRSSTDGNNQQGNMAIRLIGKFMLIKFLLEMKKTFLFTKQ